MSHSADPAGAAPRSRVEDLLEHAAWVRGVAYALVRDASTADDLVQETWLAALRRPPDGDRPLRPWLAGVVRNLARQRRRGDARRERREEAVAARGAELPTPDELAARLELQRGLADLVAELAEPFRATLLLRYYEGLSGADIARREGVPAGTVRWRLSRALELLRERLDDRHEGDRRAWALALVPLARHPLPPTGARPAPTSEPPRGLVVGTILQGVLAMGTATKVLIGGALVLVAALVLTSSGLLNGGASDDGTPVDVAFRAAPDPRHAGAGEAEIHVRKRIHPTAAEIAIEKPLHVGSETRDGIDGLLLLRLYRFALFPTT